jgi:hypothetical protein
MSVLIFSQSLILNKKPHFRTDTDRVYGAVSDAGACFFAPEIVIDPVPAGLRRKLASSDWFCVKMFEWRMFQAEKTGDYL